MAGSDSARDEEEEEEEEKEDGSVVSFIEVIGSILVGCRRMKCFGRFGKVRTFDFFRDGENTALY